jgi:hypothetical protein
MHQFKCRASMLHHIVGGALTKPTEKQMQELAMLQGKPKRTEKQEERLQELISKRDAPPALQDGAKTYCQQWLKEQLYGRYISFSSKYTEKGIECEQQGIELLAEMMNYGMIAKNEQHFENDWITGTPDIILSEWVEDIKCPWQFSTFPLFDTTLPNSDYYWQMQGYMLLTGKDKAAVNYCLIDAPEHLIDREARYVSLKAGFEEVEMELYDEVYRKMTYSDVDNSLKFKRFELQRDEKAIQAIKTMVELCRQYIQTLHS